MSLSSKHGFFFAREKSSSTLGVSRTASVSERSCVKSATLGCRVQGGNFE